MVQNLCIRTFFGIIKHYNTSNAMHNAKLFIILSTKLYILMTNILYIYIYISYLYFISLPVCALLPFILSLKCILTESETTVKFPQLYIHTLSVMDAMKSVGK